MHITATLIATAAAAAMGGPWTVVDGLDGTTKLEQNPVPEIHRQPQTFEFEGLGGDSTSTLMYRIPQADAKKVKLAEPAWCWTDEYGVTTYGTLDSIPAKYRPDFGKLLEQFGLRGCQLTGVEEN